MHIRFQGQISELGNDPDDDHHHLPTRHTAFSAFNSGPKEISFASATTPSSVVTDEGSLLSDEAHTYLARPMAQRHHMMQQHGSLLDEAAYIYALQSMQHPAASLYDVPPSSLLQPQEPSSVRELALLRLMALQDLQQLPPSLLGECPSRRSPENVATAATLTPSPHKRSLHDMASSYSSDSSVASSSDLEDSRTKRPRQSDDDEEQQESVQEKVAPPAASLRKPAKFEKMKFAMSALSRWNKQNALFRNEKVMLPESFEPTEYTVILGHREVWRKSPGNLHLKQVCRDYFDRYSTAHASNDKTGKTAIVTDILKCIYEKCPTGAFVRVDKNGQYYEVQDLIARDKIAGDLRDLLPDKYRSALKNRKRNRDKPHRKKAKEEGQQAEAAIAEEELAYQYEEAPSSP